MSWSQPPPFLPSLKSPHKAKPKQLPWIDSPPSSVKSYEECQETFGTSGSAGTIRKGHASQKKNFDKYSLQSTHQMSDPGCYLRKSPMSPKNKFEFEMLSTQHFSRSPFKNIHYQHENSSTALSDSAPATLSTPMKKYEYNVSAASSSSSSSSSCPKTENSSAGNLKLDCGGLVMKTLPEPKIAGHELSSDEMVMGHKKQTLLSPFAENDIFFATCNVRKNKIMKKRHYNVSPDGVSSLDDYSSSNTTLVYETNITGRRMSITISDGNSSEISSEPIVITESLETSSLITQSTNCSNNTTSPLASPSSQGFSMVTTASCNTLESQAPAQSKKTLCSKTYDGDDVSYQSHASSNLHKRRQAINITNNPGYRALHTSHSILSDGKRNVDRTCSDSATELLNHRKSTSDLTDDGNYRKECEKPSSKHRRRGSSKGGLAYLVEKRDSRRGSRESVISHHSNFSNEDIGPLTSFQQTQRGRQRRTSNFLELPVPDHARPRIQSLPEPYTPYNPRVSEDLYRLRTFSISKGTVVNCGDSIISRRSRSNTSVNSTTSKMSERSPFDGSCCGGYTGNDDSSSDSEPTPPPRYRVVMLGDSGTGKTALVNQFITSEYMHTYDASLDDEFGEKTVSILLDGEESELIFIDHPTSEMSVENSLSTYEPHACCLVYSIVQKTSFRWAEEILNYLWRENVTKDKAVIVVGNKADLARSRVISMSDGKQLAASRDVKFIETSSGIQHNVDELLVGILKQIRLKETREKKQLTSKMKNSRTHASLHVAKEILQKICFNQLDITKSKSCENLHVL